MDLYLAIQDWDTSILRNFCLLIIEKLFLIAGELLITGYCIIKKTMAYQSNLY